MLSESQIKEKEKKIKLVIDEYLKHDNVSIEELSMIVNIPTSSIQRYLNDVDYIHSIYGSNAKYILEQISYKLLSSKQLGVHKGGINSSMNNIPLRNTDGKFTGNKKR